MKAQERKYLRLAACVFLICLLTAGSVFAQDKPPALPQENTIPGFTRVPAPQPQQRIRAKRYIEAPQQVAPEPIQLEPQQIYIVPEPVMLKSLKVFQRAHLMLMSLSEEEINHYIQTLKSGQTIEDREHAANVLGSRAVWRYKNDPIIHDIYNALAGAFRENTDETLLRSAAFALGALGMEEAGTVLVNYLSYGNSNNVKYAVVSSLGRLQYRGAVNNMISLLLYDNDTELKARSAEALGMIGDSSANYALLSALNNNDRWVRREAIDALGNIGSPEAKYPILNILNNESDLELREAAARALRKIESAADAHRVN
jgi:hypothetical protein